ncbi:hypothetical protein QZH41_003243 [Actinostola sp. cb2023]|nr:hypothetical protein QZH41_003243 [Actinostola sp. cb2023]
MGNQFMNHITYRYIQCSRSFEASFLRIGWKKGERVAIQAPSGIEFLLSYMALNRIGALSILLPSEKPIEETIGLLNRYKCKGLILVVSKDVQLTGEHVADLKKTIEETKVVMIDTEHSQVLGNEYSRFSNLLMTGETDFSKVLERQSQVQFDDLAVVTLTSGSTGEPKAVVRTHHSIVNSALMASKFGFDIDYDPYSKHSVDRLFSDRPFYWVGGLVPIQIALSTGCTLLTAPAIKTMKECDIEFLLKLLQNEGCTSALLMPYLVVDIANYSGQMNYDRSCLKAAVTSGQPISNHLFEKVWSAAPNCKLIKAYGMTECVLIARQVLGEQEGEEGLELVSMNELKIVDENIQVLPVGQVGEICVRSPSDFVEYLFNPDATSKTISRTGWVHTGDLGKINSRGRITITGRKDDMIKRATVNIFPAEVEKVLTKYDDVKDASVVGVPDVRLYEELCACIIPKKGSTLESDMSEFEKWMSQTFTPDEQGLTLKPNFTMATMSYIHKPALEPLEHRTIIQLFDTHANRDPEREVFVLYDESGQRSSYTFKQIQQQSLRLAASFLRIGWKKGERVAIQAPSGIEFLLSYMALNRIGALSILLPQGIPIEETIGFLNRYKCQGLILFVSKDVQLTGELVADMKKTIEESKVVMIDTEHSQVLGNGCSRFSNLLLTGETDFSKVLERQSQVQFDDLAVVTLTSGSTGEPKGVVRTHHSIVNSTLVPSKFEFGIDYDPYSKQSADRLFTDRPFYWVGGLVPIQLALSTGCTLLTAPPIKTVKECDIEFLLKLLQNERCTAALLMPYLVVDIANYSGQNNYDLSCLKAALTGGQPISNHIFEKVRSVAPNCKLIKGYGMTECVSVALEVLGEQEGEEGLELISLIELKIVDENIQILPVGEVGEICLRSPTAFLEYFFNPEATRKTISRTGWVHTSDIGKMNSSGRFTITGRKDDMIKKATVKIFPAEVEQVLTKYDDVKDASVVGVPDVRLYEELCACIIPKKGSALESDMTDFEKWMSQIFTPDEQGLTLKPKYVLLVDDFPKRKTGKLDRKALKITAAKKLGIDPIMK